MRRRCVCVGNRIPPRESKVAEARGVRGEEGRSIAKCSVKRGKASLFDQVKCSLMRNTEIGLEKKAMHRVPLIVIKLPNSEARSAYVSVSLSVGVNECKL